MMTTLDIIDVLYQRLNITAIRTQITGGVFKQSRPLNSGNSDIVISCLPVTGDQMQSAVANVNIHVPNPTININGKQDDTQPDFGMLRFLTQLVIGYLKDDSTEDYYFDVQQQNIFSEDSIKEHYSNIRVNFFNINL